MQSAALANLNSSPLVRGSEKALTRFLDQSVQTIGEIERALLELESMRDALPIVSRLESLFESLRNSARTYNLVGFGALSHQASHVFTHLSRSQQSASPLVIDRMFRAVSVLRDIVKSVEATGLEGNVEVASRINELRDLTRPEALNTPVLTSMTINVHHISTENMDALNEVLPEFVADSSEHLDRVHEQLTAFSTGHVQRDSLDDIFRCFHTIKGVSTFLNLKSLETLAHAAESLLQGLRDGEIKVRPSQGTTLYHTIQIVRQMLASLERGGRDSDVVHAPMINMLNVLANDRANVLQDPQETSDTKDVTSASSHRAQTGPVNSERQNKRRQLDHVVVQRLNQLSEALHAAHDANDLDAIGELVSTLKRTMADIQTQPAEVVLEKTPRLVRRLARRAEKRVALTVKGHDVLLDRGLLAEADDILNQLIRNAVTHGIETPEARLAQSKPAEGRVTVSIELKGDDAVITVADDGQGIDLTAVRERAVERGLIPAAIVAAMSDDGLVDLIFEPGFSTAKRVGGLAGRGVGMDVVRSKVEQLNGTIRVETHSERGSTFTINLPRVSR